MAAAAVLAALVIPAMATGAGQAGQGEGSSGLRPLGAGLERVTPDKPEQTELESGDSRRKVILKFDEGTSVRLREGGFVTLGDDRLGALRDVLADYPGVEPGRLIETSSEAAIERRTERTEAESGRELADFNLYYKLSLPPDVNTEELIDDLNALGIVELAEPDVKLAPPPNHAGPTPSFVARQTYRHLAPTGIDADFANALPGGAGQNVRILDLENDWQETHEDLDAAAAGRINNGPQPVYDELFTDHGTAVLGELIATDDAIGVTGMAHAAEIRMVETFNTTDGSDRPDAINLAVTNSAPGDVILLEQQTPGANGGCDLTSQVGCVAVEWDQPVYDAIVAATAAGRIVVEAAGNGSEDLGNTADYGDPFPSGRTDSGAIIVGAAGNNYDSANCAGSTNHQRLSFSTFGPRVDYHAFGECVTTTSYGDLQDDPDDNFDYTGDFGGTSSASPMVTAAAAILSSVAQERGDADGLTSVEARALLANGATPQDTSSVAGNIGPMPNLRAALGAPTANAGGPYSVAEGSTINLDGTGSTDQAPGTISTYEWDLDNDASYDDATGANPPFLRADDGIHPIGLRVTDDDGLSATDTSTVTVLNVDPAVALDPAQDMLIAEGDTLDLLATFADPGYDDTYDASIDWGDGDVDLPAALAVTSEGPPQDEGEVTGSHLYPTPGTYPVEVRVNDDDFGFGTAAFDLTVVPRCMGVPSTIVGTDGNDVLVGTPGKDVVFAGKGNDRIRTGDGNDLICAGPGKDVSIGRAGNDMIFDEGGAGELRGGPGDDALYGLGGPDRIWGGPGRDFLFGGAASDELRGGPGRDECDGTAADKVVATCE